MGAVKSPFLAVENFLSGKQCEDIVDNLGFYVPDYDTAGKPIKMSRHHERSESVIYSKFKQYLPRITEHYGIEHRGTEHISFEFLAQETFIEPMCDNSKYINKKWTRVYDRDISCVLFLCDYQDSPPFDSDFEVYGGKLEFIQHGFGFNPQRGTLIVYPSGPHFINATSTILAGDAYQAKFHIAATKPFVYKPADYPGNYLSWFQ
jgi:hypothetical protein